MIIFKNAAPPSQIGVGVDHTTQMGGVTLTGGGHVKSFPGPHLLVLGDIENFKTIR